MRYHCNRPPVVLFLAITVLAGSFWCGQACTADFPPAAYPDGQKCDDSRLGELKDLNGYFPFKPPSSRDGWSGRATQLRRQLLVALGLWPMPTKTPLGAVVHGPVDRNEYTVQKVYFQSFPGHYVTGSLYRPQGRTGRGPAVLCPHGHWSNGRFHDHGQDEVRKQIEAGAERLAIGGRHPIQARCVQLARMGCVVFQYDMVGYADSKQLVHRPGLRQTMNTAENWGYFSPQAELRLQNMMGLQTYNSIRALDFLSGLPDVDPQRIAVTGASGGGTQTFVLCAVDPRPAVAFPAVMVSTAMQGGCTCENACYLRLETSNVEIAALFAPKPLGLTAADDWTKQMPTKGFPELQQLYRLLGAPEEVSLFARLEFGHNYNRLSRQAMYAWLNRYLGLGLAEPIEERDYRPLSIEDMTVWDDDHPRPADGDEHERALLRWITQDAEKQIAGLRPHDSTSLRQYRRVVGGALQTLIGRGLPEAGAWKLRPTDRPEPGNDLLVSAVARCEKTNEELPLVVLKRRGRPWNGHMVIWIDRRGRAGLHHVQGQLRPAVQTLLEAGSAVMGLDLLGQGEHTIDGKRLEHARLVGPDYAGYTFGYNRPLFAQRVHDILAAISLAKNYRQPAEQIHLVGLDEMAPLVAAARAIAGPAVDKAAIDTSGFRFQRIETLDHPDFLPGIVKYGDFPAMIALGSPHPVWISGEGQNVPDTITAAYRAAGQPNQMVAWADKDQQKHAAAVQWLLH